MEQSWFRGVSSLSSDLGTGLPLKKCAYIIILFKYCYFGYKLSSIESFISYTHNKELLHRWPTIEDICKFCFLRWIVSIHLIQCSFCCLYYKYPILFQCKKTAANDSSHGWTVLMNQTESQAISHLFANPFDRLDESVFFANLASLILILNSW